MDKDTMLELDTAEERTAASAAEQNSSAIPDEDSAETDAENAVDPDDEDEGEDELYLADELREELESIARESQKRIRMGTMWLCYASLLILFIGLLAAQLPMLFADKSNSAVGLYACCYLLQAACFTLLPLYVVTVKLHHSPRTLGFVKSEPLKVINCGLLFGMLLYIINLLSSTLSHLILPDKWISPQAAVNMLQVVQNRLEMVIVAVILLVLAPISEEVLFRGFMYPALRLALGKKMGVFVCAFVFAVLHGNITVFLPLFFSGLGFTLIYERYENIYYCMATHSVMNAFSLYIYLRLT